MKIAEVPEGWFLRSLVAAWIVLLVGTALIFLFPKPLAPMLGRPLWILSFFVVVGTWVYGIARVARLVRRSFKRQGLAHRNVVVETSRYRSLTSGKT